MTERLYLDRPDVYMLADCDDRDGGRARLVVCEHPDGAEYAARLAASLGLPLHYGPGPGELAGSGSQPPGHSGPTVAALAGGPPPGRASLRMAARRTSDCCASRGCRAVSRRSGGRVSRGAGRPAAASRLRPAG